MTGRQAQAFRRLGHFKGTVVRTLKRLFPDRFDQAERQIRGRMTDLDDDVVLAYLEQFLSAPPAGVDVLRDALTSQGYTLPAADDLRLWAEHLRHRAPTAAPAPADPRPAPADEPAYGTLLGLFDTDDVAPSEDEVDADVVPLDELDELDEQASSGDQPVGRLADFPTADMSDGVPDDDRPPLPDEPPAGEDVDPATAPTPGADDAPTSEPEDGHATATDDEPDAPDRSVPDDGPPFDGEGAARPAPKLGPSLRPEMIDTRRKKGKRKPRTTVTAADPKPAADLSAPADSDASLDEDARNALLSAVALPRPVFASDLTSVVGDRDVVGQWQREMQSLGMESPVRFIAAKQRHRSRGALVLPYAFLREAASEFRRSWWAGCMDLYTGRRLYELAVVLHQVGDKVVSHELAPDAATFRINERRGLTGVVAVTGTDLEDGGAARDAMADAVEELIGERLAVVAVLATHGETLEPIEQALRDEGEARGWDPPMPVVTSLSWEWADSAGASARPVLTGAG